MKTLFKFNLSAFFATGLGIAGIATPLVFAQSPYQGKAITIIQGRGPGGSGDMRVRAIAHFLPKYIPGNPSIIFEYMAGGGGLKAANHVYNSARPDGFTIGSVSSGLMSSAVLGTPGVRYQIEKFHYLGAAVGPLFHDESQSGDAYPAE